MMNRFDGWTSCLIREAIENEYFYDQSERGYCPPGEIEAFTKFVGNNLLEATMFPKPLKMSEKAKEEVDSTPFLSMKNVGLCSSSEEE